MSSICFYFQLHQPLRINPHASKLDNIFIDHEDKFLDNTEVLDKVVSKCYLPATKLILDLLNQYPDFKVGYSITGILLDQFEEYHPEIIELFQELNKTGRVEFLNETYYHSLASIYSEEEFKEQINLQKAKIKKLFGQEAVSFRNTEIIYNDRIGKIAKDLGYRNIVAEGADRILKWESPNYLYKGKSNINLLLKNYKLSDDIAFKFSNSWWFDFPMTADKFMNYVNAIDSINQPIINLFMDYETFGEHQWVETGIFEFFKYLIKYLSESSNDFILLRDVEHKLKAVKKISMPDYVSWADTPRDISAWCENEMQKESLKEIYSLENKVKKINDPKLLNIWRSLQTSDHFYYMTTKHFSQDQGDQVVHSYFSPYGTPYAAHDAYQNALKIFKAAL